MGTLLFVVGICSAFGTIGYLYSRGKVRSLQDYIVARNSVNFALTTATFIATGMGAWILFAPIETTINFGLVALIGYAIGGASPLIAFWFLGSKMRQVLPQGNTLAEFIQRRFGGISHVVILVVMVFYMFVFLTAELTAIGQTIRLITPDIPMWLLASIIGFATTAYTSYGGLRASIFTDGIQFIIMIPVLIIIFGIAVSHFGGFVEISSRLALRAQDKLDFTNQSGIETGIALIIAVLAANLFHQGYWQRIFSTENTAVLKKSLVVSSLVIVPMILVTGFFGLIALSVSQTSTGYPGIPAIALFEVVAAGLPDYIGLLLIVLAIALVMSSIDSLLNGIVSLAITSVSTNQSNTTVLLRRSRFLTIAIVIPAILIASQELSVLYMFFIADLVAAGFIVPVFIGLYSPRARGWMVVTSGFAGILISLLFFPNPDWSSVIIPLLDSAHGNLMHSFLASLFVSTGLIAIFQQYTHAFGTNKPFDFQTLQR